MKKLRVIIFSFVSIIILGIILTFSIINSNIDSGIHNIELEDKDARNFEVSLDKENDTLDISDVGSSISELEKDYVKTIFSFLERNIELKSGWYKFTY